MAIVLELLDCFVKKFTTDFQMGFGLGECVLLSYVETLELFGSVQDILPTARIETPVYTGGITPLPRTTVTPAVIIVVVVVVVVAVAVAVTIIMLIVILLIVVLLVMLIIILPSRPV